MSKNNNKEIYRLVNILEGLLREYEEDWEIFTESEYGKLNKYHVRRARRAIKKHNK